MSAQPDTRPPILSYVRDWANLCTLAGLCCGVAGIHFALQGRVAPTLLCLLGSFLFDWLDGPIARRLVGRTEQGKAYGVQLDSLVDVVCAGVAPAVLLLSLYGNPPAVLPVALLLPLAAVIRLAYFNVYGLVNNTFLGLSVDKNILALAAVGVAQPYLDPEAFRRVYAATCVVLAALNVSSLRIPKQSGRGFALLLGTALLLTGYYAVRLASGAEAVRVLPVHARMSHAAPQ